MMPIYQQLNSIRAYFDDTVASVASRYGLKSMEYHVLGILVNYPEMDSAAEIVRAIQTTKSHVSITVKELVEKGLLTRQSMQDNHKTVHLKATEQGKALIEDSARYFEEYMCTVLDGFTQEERMLFQSFCDRFTENSRKGIAALQKKP